MTTENIDFTTADRGNDFTPSASDVAEAAGRAKNDASAIVASAREVAAPVVEKTDEVDAADVAEDAAVAAKDEGAARDDKGRFVPQIPKTRFDEAVGKERDRAATAERRAQELQDQLNQISKNADTGKLEEEIQGLEQQQARFLLDGDHEKAAQLATQIRLKERTINMAQSETLSVQARAAAAEEIRMETVIGTLESTYDVMNPGNESFDQDVVDLVLGAQRQLIENDRMAPAAALAKAAQKVMSKLMPAAREEVPPAKGLGAAKEVRVASSKTKAVDAALKTPPDLSDVGRDTDKVGMTAGQPVPVDIGDLAAIPEATLKRMRGDMA